jgi:Uma2 family endonuclease
MAQNVLAPWAEPVPGQTGLMTAEELARLREDAWLYELVEGRLVRMPPPGSRHGRLGMKLALAIGALTEPRALGALFSAETGFLLSRAGEVDTVLGADIAYVRQERLPPADSPEWSGYLRLAPDLVVEVASPTQFRPELEAKARIWLGAGVPLVWVIWHRYRSVDVWRGDRDLVTLGAGDQLDAFDIVPGFKFPVRDLFF